MHSLPTHSSRVHGPRPGGTRGLAPLVLMLLFAAGCVVSTVVLRRTQAENATLKDQLKAQGTARGNSLG